MKHVHVIPVAFIFIICKLVIGPSLLNEVMNDFDGDNDKILRPTKATENLNRPNGANRNQQMSKYFYGGFISCMRNIVEAVEPIHRIACHYQFAKC